jgi:hypothetical protein
MQPLFPGGIIKRDSICLYIDKKGYRECKGLSLGMKAAVRSHINMRTDGSYKPGIIFFLWGRHNKGMDGASSYPSPVLYLYYQMEREKQKRRLKGVLYGILVIIALFLLAGTLHAQNIIDISGTVTDSALRPVSGIDVTLRRMYDLHDTTDAKGRYRLYRAASGAIAGTGTIKLNNISIDAGSIRLSLSENSPVTIQAFDLSGKQSACVYNGNLGPGRYQFQRKNASNLQIYKISVNGNSRLYCLFQSSAVYQDAPESGNARSLGKYSTKIIEDTVIAVQNGYKAAWQAIDSYIDSVNLVVEPTPSIKIQADVYSAILDSFYHSAKNGIHVIDTTVSRPGSWYPSSWVNDSIDTTLLRSLTEKPYGTIPLSRLPLHTANPCIWVGLDYIWQLCTPGDTLLPNSCYANFFRLYPNTTSLKSFSAIGLDQSFTRALVYVAADCGTLCGYGWLVELEKNANRWLIAKSVLLWIS